MRPLADGARGRSARRGAGGHRRQPVVRARSRSVAAAPASGAPGSAVGTRYTFVSPEYFSDPADSDSCRDADSAPDEGRASARVAIVSAATAQRLLARRRSDRAVHPHRAAGRPAGERASRATPRSPSSASSPTWSAGCIFDGQDAGHIYLPMHPADPHAIALLMRPRSDRELGPSALQEIFRRVAPDPQVFEADAARRDARGADVSASRGVVDRLAARGDRAGAERVRAVRGAVLHADAAHAGDRHPHGARRDGRRGRAAGDGAVRAPGGDRAPRSASRSPSACSRS